MYLIDLVKVVLNPLFPVNNWEDRLVVLLLSPFAYGLSGFTPEQYIAAVLVTTGISCFTSALYCLSSKRLRTLLCIISLVSIALGPYLLVNLTPKPISLGPYGKLPVKSKKDYPTLPKLDELLTNRGQVFTDSFGRTILLRGVNLGGDTKVPAEPHGATWNKKDFFNYKDVSFVGRPFPLEEADEHLGRIASWGFTFLRFLITWEAIEHEAPGVYDYEYLDYVVQVVRKCQEYNISVFIDPHQDVWSRWTGGDGAPAWTLEKVGFKLENLYASGAAITHQEHGDPYPRMIWPTNYNRLAAATMFTLFFGGKVYAPNTKIEGKNPQDYLQDAYFDAMKVVAQKLRNEPNVHGYDTMNEPSNGYIGLKSLRSALFAVPLGWHMSCYEGMLLGHGHNLAIPFFSSPLVFENMENMNSKGVLAWKSAAHDIWLNEGVWGYDKDKKPILKKPGYFAKNGKGDDAEFLRDFMVPFFERFKKEIHSVHPDAVIFAEPYIDTRDPLHNNAPEDLVGNRYAWAPHYYDGLTLVLKRSRPWIALDVLEKGIVLGQRSAQQAISRNLHHVKHTGMFVDPLLHKLKWKGAYLGGLTEMQKEKNGRLEDGAPVLLGEIGIPMDLDRDKDGIAYAYKSGDFTSQMHALERSMRGLEESLMSFTLWNYAAGNTNKRGDLWNDEDLSLFSRDQQSESIQVDLNSGGRALASAVRPYPFKTCGHPLEIRFEPFSEGRPFIFRFQSYRGDETVLFFYAYAKHRTCDPKIAPTIIYVPNYQYPNGYECNVSDGTFTIDTKNQYLTYIHKNVSAVHSIHIWSK